MSIIRKIVHIDCDSFYASIETRDNPALSGLPVAVGGAPERRGVVATCNYVARQFGIHSAMASATARRLCPDLVIIRPDISTYRRVSRQIHGIFRNYTDLIEPLSLDEAYLDLTENSRHAGDANATATEIRDRIANEIHITVSAGIAPNKFLAKIASDWHKPNGQLVIEPDQVDGFVRQLPVHKLFGVGRVTARRLRILGIENCEDLRAMTRSALRGEFGSFGDRLYELCRGVDHRPVLASRTRKSVSVENTFATDLPDQHSCLARLPELLAQLNSRLQGLHGQYVVTKQVVKVKFHDFVSTTVETQSKETDPELFRRLLQAGYQRGNRPVRLLGLGVRLMPAQNLKRTPQASAHGTLPDTDIDELQLALFKD